jgi:1,4-alpha-glucan branching enzyme
VPYSGVYEEVFNTDAIEFGGSGVTSGSNILSEAEQPMHGFEQSIALNVPPMAVVYLRCKSKAKAKQTETKPKA